MANGAVLPLHPLRKLSLVFVPVAGGAQQRFPAKLLRSGVIYFMTEDARLSSVCACQREIRFPVIGRGKFCRDKSVDVVARFTPISLLPVGELAVVIILMTVGTILMGKRLFRLTRLVALFTVHRSVFPPERIGCQVVIKL